MKFAVLAIVLLPFAMALGPELVNSPEEQPDNADNELLNEFGGEDDFGEPVEELFNELASEDNQEGSSDVLEEVFKAQWDISPPEFSVKKKKMPAAGKVLEKIVLTKAFKNTIVAAHNRARSVAAPPASNMRKMTWDNSLEKLATTYTRKCIYEHNPNAKHKRFQYVGENLFISMGLPYNKNLLDHAVRAWDGEKTVYDYNTMTCQRGKVCGHYTQVVWADSFKVGCGVTRCGNIDVRGRKWKNAILFGCNYGPGGNYRNEKPYQTGKKCTDCDDGDKCKGKLCANMMRDRLFFNPKKAKWSPWSKWSPCSVSCGMGSKRRERKCNTFVPTDCKGFGSEVKFCMAKPCRKSPTSFRYEVVLNDGDNLLPADIADLFGGRGGTFFTRTTG